MMPHRYARPRRSRPLGASEFPAQQLVNLGITDEMTE